MVEPMAVSIAGKVASKLLEQVMEATKIAISCKKCCKALHALLKELQPIVDHAVRQISQSNFDNASKRPRSAVHDWLDELEGTLKRAEVEVNKCIEQQPNLNPVSRYNTGKRILDVTESVKKLLQQAGLVGLVVAFSQSSRAQKMMQEIHEMMNDLRRIHIEFATFTQESLEKAHTRSSAQVITSDITSAFYNLSLGASDNMSRADTGAFSSSSCPRELIVNEDAHKLTDIQQVRQPVFGLDNLTMKLQQSITSSDIDAEPRCVGVSGMGGAGKTLLAQIAYNSREVRKHFKGGNLIWLTVSQTPNIKGLFDSFCTQLGLRPMRFAQLEEEYRTRLYNGALRRRVFLVLDDVWDKGVLEQLDLAKGRGSVTLVTTRNRPVLEKAGVKDEDEVQVGVLSKEDSWKLFCVHAFPRGLSNISSQVQGDAELVAEECKGLPLALKVIGGSMVGKSMPQEWQCQLNCLRESHVLGQQEEEALFGRLKLSYDNLDYDSPVCKECFLGFAAFPEDHMVDMEELIKLWKAQGLLDDPTKMFGDDPTLFAYYLVGLLIVRSLIELTEARYTLSYRYKVHDVMRDLALRIIKGQSPITCLYQPGRNLVEFPRDWIQTYERQPCEVRNLSLMENDLTTLNGVTFSAPKLDVLLLAQNEKLEAMPKQFLKGIENLKVLEPGTSQGKSR
jgi:disease resistance protein RPS2